MARRGIPSLESIHDQNTREAIRLLWDKIEILSKQTLVIASGSLFPDQRPNLTSQDIGTLFYASDYNRLYKWNGSAWEDNPGAPSRNQVSFFFGNPNPQAGWSLCNGSTVQRSTSSGSTEAVTVPIMAPSGGLLAWIRL